MSRVAINQMDERHDIGQGTTGQQKRLLLLRGHCDDDMGAQ